MSVSVPTLYSKHREWALTLVPADASTEDKVTALVALWSACKEWKGGRGFQDYARRVIGEALARGPDG